MFYENHRIPVIRLWHRLLVPVQGDITDAMAAQLLQDVLEVVAQGGVRGIVVDVTGALTLDSHICHVLSQLAASAKLMGAPTVLCGINPEMAITLQTMGISLATKAALSLEDALTDLGIEVRDQLEQKESAALSLFFEQSDAPATQEEDT